MSLLVILGVYALSFAVQTWNNLALSKKRFVVVYGLLVVFGHDYIEHSSAAASLSQLPQ
jgi:hypothetical protein